MNSWQRVSPIALLYFFANNITLLVNNMIYMVPLIFTSYKTISEDPVWLVLGISGILSLIALSAFLQYYFFKFRLSDQTIEIKSGVFKKVHLNLPFARIQNVKIISPFYFRPFDYTTIELDTAGSAKSEAKIVALKVEFSNQLKQEILNHATVADSSQQSDPSVNPSDEIVLNRRSLKDLVIHGITNNRVWIFLVLLAPFFETAAKNIENILNSVGINFSELFSPETHAWWQLGLYAAALLAISYCIVMLLSVLGSIIAFYGFTLSKQGTNYIRRSGLLTRHEVVMKLPRLQLVISQQDWLDVLINRINLRFEQAKQGQQKQPGQDIRNKIMVPSVSQAEFQELLDDVWPNNRLLGLSFSSINKRFLTKYLSLFLPIPTALLGLMVYKDQWGTFAMLGVAMIVISGLIVMRWIRWGYAVDENFIYIRKGVLGVNYYVFPIHKIQQTKFHQSVLMARRKLASVSLVLASGTHKIPFLPQKTARELIDRSLYVIESTKRNWM